MIRRMHHAPCTVHPRSHNLGTTLREGRSEGIATDNHMAFEVELGKLAKKPMERGSVKGRDF